MKGTAVALLFVVGTCALLTTGESANAKRQVRVGYVVEAGVTPNRRELVGLPYDGFVRAVKALHVEGRALQVAPNQDPTNALRVLARQRYDLVVMGVPDPPAVAAVAREYPETKFLLPDAPVGFLKPPPKNIQGTIFRAEQAGYLAGYLSALMEERRPGRDVISSVGGYKVEGVDRWIVGYEAGARRADPRIVTIKTYAKSFTNPAKCKTVALGQIAQGAGVVLNVAGGCGFGALEAAKEKSVWGVGVDIDQSFLGRHILTSAVIRSDVAVFSAIQRLVKGRFRTGGDTTFDLRNGGVGLGKVNTRVPQSFLGQVDNVRRQIITGKIRVPRVT